MLRLTEHSSQQPRVSHLKQLEKKKTETKREEHLNTSPLVSLFLSFFILGNTALYLDTVSILSTFVFFFFLPLSRRLACVCVCVCTFCFSCGRLCLFPSVFFFLFVCSFSAYCGYLFIYLVFFFFIDREHKIVYTLFFFSCLRFCLFAFFRLFFFSTFIYLFYFFFLFVCVWLYRKSVV